MQCWGCICLHIDSLESQHAPYVGHNAVTSQCQSQSFSNIAPDQYIKIYARYIFKGENLK